MRSQAPKRHTPASIPRSRLFLPLIDGAERFMMAHWISQKGHFQYRRFNTLTLEHRRVPANTRVPVHAHRGEDTLTPAP